MVIKIPSYSPGALVQTRGRNWVVLPADDEDVVRLRPVDGSDEEYSPNPCKLRPAQRSCWKRWTSGHNYRLLCTGECP